MKKRSLILILLLLIITLPFILIKKVIAQQSGNTCICNIDFSSNSCIGQNSQCGPNGTCSCQAIIDANGTVIGCLPGVCVALNPTPTSTQAQHGTCAAYNTGTGCIPVNVQCDPGYNPVIDPNCTFCLCERSLNTPKKCITPSGNTGIETAVGCIPTDDPNQFVAWILQFAIGIGGGIAFLLMIFGAIKILTSGGNPENVKAGQQMISSAVMGLLFIIFSLFLLQLIGVKILNIPEFGTP